MRYVKKGTEIADEYSVYAVNDKKYFTFFTEAGKSIVRL